MALKLPRIIGHRGAAAYAPENTLESIRTAADMGIEWVEFDVKLTKDGVPILMHDETLERTTNGGQRLVAETTYEEIKELEAGSWFADSFAGVKIPTLEEAVDVLLEHSLGVNVEIKPCPGREKETAEIALDVLSQIWDDHDRLLISSFQHVSLEAAFDMAEDWHRGLLLGKEWPENWQEMAEYLKVSTVNIDGRTATREQVESIIDLGLPVLAYTINDQQRAKTLLSWGVDGFFSDAPDVIKEGLLSLH
ncbi:MAG: glycerophosphoryl diester phosphodiesterase [Alphaproteobacteria bacterium]|nr:glycerophosphoryl diester phosphodiesterase [Alphaproteobacteria bacterium]